MGKMKSKDIELKGNSYEYVSSPDEVGGLNQYFDVDFENYFVLMDGNRYAKVIGIDSEGNKYPL